MLPICNFSFIWKHLNQFNLMPTLKYFSLREVQTCFHVFPIVIKSCLSILLSNMHSGNDKKVGKTLIIKICYK